MIQLGHFVPDDDDGTSLWEYLEGEFTLPDLAPEGHLYWATCFSSMLMSYIVQELTKTAA